MDWWALPNASLIMQIHSAIYEILVDKAFTATDGLISQSFVIAFVHPIYLQIALIWGFPAQLSLWKSVHWLWRYKLNEVCDIMVKIGLERIDTQKEVMVKVLLDSGAMKLVMSLEFARKQKFKLRKIERPIYIRNMDRTFNKERSIKHIVEINIYY